MNKRQIQCFWLAYMMFSVKFENSNRFPSFTHILQKPFNLVCKTEDYAQAHAFGKFCTFKDSDLKICFSAGLHFLKDK